MGLRVETNPALFDMDRIVAFIQGSYWGAGRSAEDIKRAFSASCVVGLFDEDKQLGMARAVSDGVYSAFIYDLFVFEDYRGHGHARRLMDALMAHPELCRVRGWMLATRDAHGLYAKYGFAPVDPGRYMAMSK